MYTYNDVFHLIMVSATIAFVVGPLGHFHSTVIVPEVVFPACHHAQPALGVVALAAPLRAVREILGIFDHREMVP